MRKRTMWAFSKAVIVAIETRRKRGEGIGREIIHDGSIASGGSRGEFTPWGHISAFLHVHAKNQGYDTRPDQCRPILPSIDVFTAVPFNELRLAKWKLKTPCFLDIDSRYIDDLLMRNVILRSVYVTVVQFWFIIDVSDSLWKLIIFL